MLKLAAVVPKHTTHSLQPALLAQESWDRMRLWGKDCQHNSFPSKGIHCSSQYKDLEDFNIRPVKSDNARIAAQTRGSTKELELALQSKERVQLMKIRHQLFLSKKPTRKHFKAFLLLCIYLIVKMYQF